MFVQISPSEHDVSETLSSLNFATRVRGVELGPARKQVDTGEIQKLKAMVWLMQVFLFLLLGFAFLNCVTDFHYCFVCHFQRWRKQDKKADLKMNP